MNHEDRMRLLVQVKERWEAHLGTLFQVPSDGQLCKWLSISRWDANLVCASIEDLKSRAKWGMDPHNPYRHALLHVSAALIRRVAAKYPNKDEQVAA